MRASLAAAARKTPLAMARLVLYALAALATRAYDWTTPGDALTPFDCDAYPNPIQVFKADNQNPP